MSEPLIESFLAAVSEVQHPAFSAMSDLPLRLRTLYDEGRGQWSQLTVDADHFVAYIAARLPEDRQPEDALEAVRAGDLYLTCACDSGDQSALLAFDNHYMSEIEIALARMRVSASQVDEVKQLVRQKLFVPSPTRRGRIADYSGRGDLRRWVRSIAVRTCLNQMRKGKRELPTQDDRVFDAMSARGDDPEMAYMKERYRIEFREAFLEALDGLTDRQQNLLRYHHVDELNIDEIGAIYRVHRVTAYRWLEKARTALVGKTQKLLRARLKVEQGEFESIMRMIRSQIHLSLVRHLGERGGVEDGVALPVNEEANAENDEPGGPDGAGV